MDFGFFGVSGKPYRKLFTQDKLEAKIKNECTNLDFRLPTAGL